jgi:hypothetical protein
MFEIVPDNDASHGVGDEVDFAMVTIGSTYDWVEIPLGDFLDAEPGGRILKIENHIAFSA